MVQIFGNATVSTGASMFAAATGGERLFFAIFPDPAEAASLAALGTALRRRNGLAGAVLPARRLHVTLAFVGQFAPVPADLLGAARAAGDRVAAAPFPIAFARAGSLAGRCGRHPFVLSGGALAPLHELQRQLVQALVDARAIAAPGVYEPHLTLLYDRQQVPADAIAVPGFRADGFSLVRSSGDSSDYQCLQSWALTD